MTDYSKLIDAETWAFIERTNSFYPADAVEQSVGEQRHTYDSMCRAFHAGHPQGVTATDTAIGTPTHRMPIRIYRNARPDDAAMVLYFHGGGFILGGLDSHDDVCAEICRSITGWFPNIPIRLPMTTALRRSNGRPALTRSLSC
jgi:acetyl esterase